MREKSVKYGVILMGVTMMLVGCTNVTNTKEYKELQANYEELQIELEEKEKQLELKDEAIKKVENEIKNLKSQSVEEISTSTDNNSTENQYVEKYGVDVSKNRTPFNETVISNLDLITNNGADKLTQWEQECYFNNWNTVMLDQNNVWHFDEHCKNITGNLDLLKLSFVDLSKSKNCYKCGW